jgi:polygalacturonase
MLQRVSVALILAIGSLRCQTVCDPASFGAQANGTTKDTAAIQSAIDSCANAGGGVVQLSSGTYLSAPIILKSNVTLSIAQGVTLLGSSDPADYQPAKGTSLLPLISATGQSDFAITGSGAIDGAGAPWWAAVRAAAQAGQPEPNRPRLIQFNSCQRIRVEGVTLLNSPSFHLVPSGCQNVVIDHVTIQAPSDSPNTDGIDPGASRNVRISNCLIDNGDDNIAIKSGTLDPNHPGAGSENITVTDCTFLHGHGMSIGSETNGGVRNVQVQRCSFDGTTNGLRIKSYRGMGGEVSQISYSDISMKNVGTAILFTAYYPNIPATDAPQPITPLTPFYHDIKITNLTATGGRSAGTIVGVPEIPLAAIVLDHVNISGGTALGVRNASVQTSATSVRFVLQDNGQVSDYFDPAPPADAVVAADGTGDFRTVQEAVDAVPDNNSSRYVIHIKPGVYFQQVTIPATKPFVTLRGDTAVGTVMVSDSTPATSVLGSDFEADNLTFENAYGTGAPAAALAVMADRAIFRNSRFIGWQGTLNANSPARQYYQNCYIEGDVDFIFGDAAAVFDGCEAHSKGPGYVTAQSKSDPAESSGYVFQNCNLTGANTGSGVYLGHPLGPYAEAVFLNCSLGSQVRPEGWTDLPGAQYNLTAFFGEYQSTGAGASPATRVSWSRQLGADDAAPFAPNVFLAGPDAWDPTHP